MTVKDVLYRLRQDEKGLDHVPVRGRRFFPIELGLTSSSRPGFLIEFRSRFTCNYGPPIVAQRARGILDWECEYSCRIDSEVLVHRRGPP